MLRVSRILETALDCEVLARTSAFYMRLLGVTPMLDTERLVAIDAGEGTVLLLFQRGLTDAIDSDGGRIPGHDPGGSGHLAFAIPGGDVALWEARLTELGVAIESRVTWDRGGVSLYFRDPDNRSVELATPGIWPTY